MGAIRTQSGQWGDGMARIAEEVRHAPDEPTRRSARRPSDGRLDAPVDARASPATLGPERPRPSWATVGIFLLLLVAALAYARAFLTPILLAVFLALVFSPVRRAICRLGPSTGWAAAGIVGALCGVLLTVGTLLATPVVGWVADAPSIGARLEERVREVRTTLVGGPGGVSIDEVVEDVKDAAAAADGADAPTVTVAGAGPTERLAALAPVVLVQTALVLVLLLFLLASGDMFYEKIVHVTPRFRDKRRAMRTAHAIERKLSRYLLTITMVNAGLGVAVGLAMWALGMPDPLLFGTLAWLLNYVPYVGAIVGTALVAAVGLLAFDGLWQALLPCLVYYGLTAVEGQLVTPWLVGRELRLNTVVVFVAIVFWAWLWSIVGMLIAVPVLVAIRTICEAIPGLEPVADFLSARGAERDEGAPPTPSTG